MARRRRWMARDRGGRQGVLIALAPLKAKPRLLVGLFVRRPKHHRAGVARGPVYSQANRAVIARERSWLSTCGGMFSVGALVIPSDFFAGVAAKAQCAGTFGATLRTES